MVTIDSFGLVAMVPEISSLASRQEHLKYKTLHLFLSRVSSELIHLNVYTVGRDTIVFVAILSA